MLIYFCKETIYVVYHFSISFSESLIVFQKVQQSNVKHVDLFPVLFASLALTLKEGILLILGPVLSTFVDATASPCVSPAILSIISQHFRLPQCHLTESSHRGFNTL